MISAQIRSEGTSYDWFDLILARCQVHGLPLVTLLELSQRDANLHWIQVSRRCLPIGMTSSISAKRHRYPEFLNLESGCLLPRKRGR
jgi:hypothetical protein